MDELSELCERIRTQRPVAWDQLPDFSLYMDQVLSYMDRQVLRFEDNDGLTSAMVNNYTKSGLLPRADGKKYTREHLAYLTAICILKRVMSTRDMELLFSAQLRQRESVSEGYEVFCESLDKALNLVSDIMEAYASPEEAADAAVHFALLSYAAGLASSRYVELLRREDADSREETEKSPKKARASRTKSAKEEK
ncbi:MAG: DUF1836 domain-containing protein [Oscillibacter sp.]|jgi:hypothetical protein|nr:DUF1836 domain-containing protein [Oscillibacter sp.]